MPGTVTLKAVEGPIQGKEFAFDQHDTFIFGRARDCHARLSEQDEFASRHHFIIEVSPPAARLRDLGSKNGTFVNGKKCGARKPDQTPEEAAGERFPEIDLAHGDRISVGKTVFSVEVCLPAACAACGAPIAEAEAPAEACLCPRCAVRAGRSENTAPIAAERRCSACGKAFPAETAGHEGPFVCRFCTRLPECDPYDLLVQMLHEAECEHGGKRPTGIPGYKMEMKLGEGGMGAVYLATRATDARKVAVKVMLAKVAVSEKARRSFLREIDVIRELRHPHIVELIEHGAAGTGFYFVMDFCPGGSVADLQAQRRKKLPLREAGPIVLQALEGLAHMHERGFVHRDLKPHNILLTDRVAGVARIADFGLAKGFERAGFSGFTSTSTVAGSLEFMAREQVTNYKHVKPPTDVWGMGASLYCMITGAVPRDFTAGMDPILVVLSQPAVPIRKRDPAVPAKAAEIIDKALADDVGDRYATAAEFKEALQRVV